MIENGAPASGVLLLERPSTPSVMPTVTETENLSLQAGVAGYGRKIRRAVIEDVAMLTVLSERSDAQECCGNPRTEAYSDSWEPVAAIPDIVVLDPEVARKARITAILGELAALSGELTVLWEAGTSIFDPARLDLAHRRTTLKAELTRLKNSSL